MFGVVVVVVHVACYGSSVAPGCHGFLLIDGGLVELIVPRASSLTSLQLQLLRVQNSLNF